MAKYMNNEIFVKRANQIHNNKYDYSKVQYVDAETEIIISCPVHGDFTQKPHIHLSGCDCPKCAHEAIGNSHRLTTNEFINKAQLIHNNKYDYSKVEYKDMTTKVEIICPVHGSFFQDPHSHLKGSGCQKCGQISTVSSTRSSAEEFIRKSNIVHNNKYNYDKVVYTGSMHKVIITCPEHGDFLQRPNAHLAGHGCPVCNTSFGEDVIKSYLNDNNILYQRHLYINDGPSVMYPDFVLIDKNIWIEYNGEQHYSISEYFQKDINGFVGQLNRDIIKRIYCRDNSISLIEIPYTFNTRKKIIEFLDKVLFQGINFTTLVNQANLYKLDDTGFKLEDLFP